jgi:hypothetical protein
LSIKKETIVADVDEISGWKLINYGEVIFIDKPKIQKGRPITAGLLKSKKSLFALQQQGGWLLHLRLLFLLR